MTDEGYHDLLCKALYAAVFTAGGAEAIVPDAAGNPGADIELRPGEIVTAFASVLAGIAVQTGLYRSDRERRALADTIRTQFLQLTKAHEAELARGAGRR